MTDHSDLIERLRALADCDSRAGEPLGKCMRRAADKIERLADHVDYIEAQWLAKDAALSSQSLSLSEAREEIERLRGALKPLADRIDEIEQVKAVAKFAAEGTAAVKLELLRNARSALENGPAGLADATNDPSGPSLSSLRKGAEVAPPCPHAPTYDAGLCCGHPDDCTFVSPSNLSKDENDA